MKKMIALLFVMVCIISCKMERVDIVGTWIQPIPGQAGIQGFTLHSDGKANSVNMHTLIYHTWRQEGDKLIVSGESLGNGQTISFTETYTIEKRSTSDSLFLINGDVEMAFGRADNNTLSDEF